MATPTLTLSQLLTIQDRDQILGILLAQYQAAGFPVTAWETGGVERTRLAAIATAIADISGNYIPKIAAGGFVDFATGDWLRLLAQEVFGIAYNPATRTVGNITLTATASAGPFTISAGQLIAVFPGGNRYINTTGGTLASGGNLTLSFQSEFANDSANGLNYNDPSNSTPTLVTALPGVTLTNPAGTFSTVAHTGAGTGTLTLGGSPGTYHQISVRIDTTGQSGAAAWSYSVDGQPYVSAGTVSTLSNVGGTLVNITLTNGTLNPSFVQGDTYLFNTPGSWITTQGADIESDTSLATRCRDRWSSLSAVPTLGMYELWATSTPSVGSQVTQVKIVQDTVVNNRINIVIAGPAGALPPATISAVQSYISARSPITDNPVVVSPSQLGITLAGTITVAVNKLTPAQSAITTAMTAYVDDVGINGTLRLATITELLMQIDGVIDVSGLTINGSATNLTLGSSSTFVIPASTPTLSFTYVTQ